ncbi:MAG: glycosyltransferase family 4 protein [Acidobacteriaceae bacterium]|nr:glycosyltransferase family 4 protein [Acidobacteriaceae bacterium]
MKVLLVHNYYQLPGGEDVVFARHRDLLKSFGHEVLEYVRTNDELKHCNSWQYPAAALKTIWAWDTVRDLRHILAREKPDIAHFHNTFPLVSPAAYYACRDAGTKVIQNLDNARLICSGGTLTRHGLPCEECVGTTPWRGVLHACYRNSRIQTGVVAATMSFHRHCGTWTNQVSTYLASTEFYRSKFIQGGLPSSKIVVKPHFVTPDPGPQYGGSYALFIGRLAPEKGVDTLLAAWESLGSIPLKIRGEGPLRSAVAKFIASHPNVELVDRLDCFALSQLIKNARFLVWPSHGNYETFGLVAIESFACGVPVIASDTGVMREMVQDGVTGLHFTARDPRALADKVQWAWNNPSQLETMGRNGRALYETTYTSDVNYRMLMDIYTSAIATS